MDTKYFLQIMAIATIGISTSFADKITLTSGVVIEGKVLEETETEYILEVFVTRTIKDRKTYKKSEVQSIEAEATDLKPYEALKGILPTPDFFPAEDYQSLIETRVRPFIENFPKSQHLAEVKAILATLESELKRAQAGDIKLDGQWISAKDWNSNAYELDAQIELGKMQKAAKRNRYRSALIAYDALAHAYPSSDALEKGKNIARGILPKYLRIISAKVEAAKEKKAARENSLKKAPSRDIRRIKAAHAEVEARYQTALERARKNRSKWLPVNDFDERNLKIIERNILTFTKTLDRPNRNKQSNSQLYRDAWETAGKGDIQATTKLLSNLKSAKVDNKYLEAITTRLEANPAPKEVKEETKEAMKEEMEDGMKK